MSPEEIENWLPAAEQLPDAGRVMYRVDTTLDEPIRSSILCGPCGTVTTIDGHKPSEYACPKCGIRLWQEEE
jgi:ribosomal protein S27AE